MTTTIHFVRHGEVHNPAKILYGRLARFRLSSAGIEQAQAAARHLASHPLQAVYHSPMLRARQTAAYIAAPHQLKLRRNALLNEVFSPYQGKPYSVLDAIQWRMYEDVQPPYESPADLLARLQKFCSQILGRHAGGEVVAVTHGDIVVHAQLWARGLALTHENRMSIQPYPATGSLSTLHFESDTPRFSFLVPY